MYSIKQRENRFSETLVENRIFDPGELKNILMGEKRFGAAKEQVTTGHYDIRESGKKVFFKVLFEVDSDIATKKEVEDTHTDKTVLEVSTFEAHEAANGFPKRPSVSARRIEIIVPPKIRKPPCDFELAIASGRSEEEGTRRDIDADDFKCRGIQSREVAGSRKLMKQESD